MLFFFLMPTPLTMDPRKRLFRARCFLSDLPRAFCAYAYPAPYPEETRIRQEGPGWFCWTLQDRTTGRSTHTVYAIKVQAHEAD